jgi:arginyl-tRNA synthetase
LDPSGVVNYLFDLSHAISVCLERMRVKGAAPEIAEARMLLFWAGRITLANGMKILGLQPLERM